MTTDTTNRREFLRTATRLVLLGGVGALGAHFWLRQRGQECVNNGMCGGCGEFTRGCELPDAQAARRQPGKGGFNG